MKMAFMQKAMDKQRERARVEASVVLRELEEAAAAAAAAADGSDDDEAVRRNKREKKRGGKAGDAAGTTEDAGVVSKETRAEATAEVAKALPAGALQSSAVGMDARVRSSVASPITIDLGGGSDPVLSSAAEGKAETLNRSSKKTSTGGGGKGGKLERSKKRRQAEVDGGDADRGREEEGDEEEDDDQHDDKSNPWLAPTPRRSKSRRRAPNGEVLLDVRKAAATALSAFGGGSVGGKEGPSARGDATDDVVEHEGGGDAKDAGNDSTGPPSSGKKKKKSNKNKNKSPPNEQAEQEQGGGRKKRKKRKRGGGGGGGGGDVNGREGASGDGTNGEGAEARATTEKAGSGNKKAKTAPGPNGKSGVKKSGEGSTATPKLVGLSNDELVRRAFAAPDFESEFKDSKDDEIEGELAKGREKLPGTLAGWGAWAGDGAPAPRGPTKHQVLAKNAQVCFGCITRKKEEPVRFRIALYPPLYPCVEGIH